MFEESSESLTGIGLRVCGVTVGLLSNAKELITSPEYFGGIPHPAVVEGKGWNIGCQEANFKVERIKYEPPPTMNGYFYIFNYKDVIPSLHISEDSVIAIGDWLKLEAEAFDRRYSLLGNQGVLFRYFLTVLERKGIYNFHACGLVDKDTKRAYLILGERGSGKSAVLLAALESGRYLSFGTEIIHAGFENDKLIFYRGCMRNNVRVGHLLYDFPKLAEKIGIRFAKLNDPWGTKVQIDLSPFSIPQEKIIDPELIIVIPRIEEELSKPQITYMDKPGKVKRHLLENISDKIVSLALIYERIPVGSLDNPYLLRSRMEFVDRLIEKGRIVKIVNLFASPHNCLEGLKV